MAPKVFSEGDDIIAAQPIVAPVNKVIESPGKTRAGYRLKSKKAESAPRSGKSRNSPSCAFVRNDSAMSDAVMMIPRPAPSKKA